MPRIRTIKPDAFLSESLSSVPRGTRWTFAGLWTYADDKGRARDDARLIKAALYPLDDDVTLADVVHDLDLLWQIGGICRYIVDGRSYLHMPKWGHQKINRPTPPKSPPCPVHEDGMSGHVLNRDDSLSTHGALTEPSVGEKEGKGREKEWEGEGESEADASDATPSRSLALITDNRPDVDRVCTHLADQREALGSKRPEITPRWRNEARLLIDNDGRTEEQVHACIRWLFTSSNRDARFWRTNVRSMPKLRAEYDRLRELADQPATGSSKADANRDMLARAMERAKAKEAAMRGEGA